MEADRSAIFRSAAEVVGCLIAPIPIIVVGMVESIFYASFDVVTSVVFSLIAYAMALGFTVLLGYPLYRLVVRINAFRWWTSMLSGAAVGALVTMLIAHPTHILSSDVPINAAAAAVSGLLFWTVQWRAERAKAAREQ